MILAHSLLNSNGTERNEVVVSKGVPQREFTLGRLRLGPVSKVKQVDCLVGTTTIYYRRKFDSSGTRTLIG